LVKAAGPGSRRQFMPLPLLPISARDVAISRTPHRGYLIS